MSREYDDERLPLSRTPPVSEDVRRELAFHLEQRKAELVAQGVAPAEAERIANESFGDPGRVAAECRTIERKRRSRIRRAERLGAFGKDLIVGFRGLRRSPGFALMAILTLGLGSGATATMFSIVNQVLLRPLPYAEPDRLVTIEERHENGGAGSLPWPNFRDLEARSRTVTAMTSFAIGDIPMLAGNSALRTRMAIVSEGFFRVFPVRPVLGRLPNPEDHQRGAAPVAVVSYSFWRDVLGEPRSLQGVRIRANADFAVIGVLPQDFDFADGAQVFAPMELQEQSTSRTAHNYDTIGRLAPGASAESAERELATILADLKSRYYPDFDAVGAEVIGLQEARTGSLEKPLWLLLGASGLFLLAACTNLASGVLARGTARLGEIAVRSALGATRTRLIRQLLTESALLAGLGSLAGIVMALGLLRALVPLAPAELHLDRVRIDGWVGLFALVVALTTTALFGLFPALRLSRSNTVLVLREAGVRSAGAGRLRAWRVMIGVEIALALALLSGSALLIRSFMNVMAVDLGFDPDHVAIVTVDLPSYAYEGSSSTIAAFHERTLQEIGRIPGVERVGFANRLPLSGGGPSGALQVEGKPLDPRGEFNAYSVYRVIGGDFFAATGIPLIRGRALGPGDDRAAPPVVIVSQTFADQEWPGADPIGKRVKVAGMDPGDEPWYTVIGVVGNVRTASVLDRQRATWYFDHRQRPPYRTRTASYAVRTRGDPAPLLPAFRRTIAAIDPQVAVVMHRMEEDVSAAVADRRFSMLVLGSFAALALILAVIGTYGVVSYAVAQRSREIGVRRALGASSGQLRRMVLGSTLLAIGPGILAGTLLAVLGSRALRALLYGVSSFDVLTLALAILVLGIAGLVASLIPAGRAARVDPLIAMRFD